jgi:hypothetical protein
LKKNIIYPIIKATDFTILIDSVFSKCTSQEGLFKALYVSFDDLNHIPFAYISDEIKIDCDFCRKVKEVFHLASSNPIITDNPNDDRYKLLQTVLIPDSHHSYVSKMNPLKNFKGFYFKEGFLTIYKRFGTNWTFSGHSCSFYEEESEMIDIDKIKEMNSFEFYEYFHSLVYD